MAFATSLLFRATALTRGGVSYSAPHRCLRWALTRNGDAGASVLIAGKDADGPFMWMVRICARVPYLCAGCVRPYPRACSFNRTIRGVCLMSSSLSHSIFVNMVAGGTLGPDVQLLRVRDRKGEAASES